MYLCIYAYTAMTMILSICKHTLYPSFCAYMKNIPKYTVCNIFTIIYSTVHEYIHKHGQDRSIFAEHREAQARFRSVIHLSPVMCCHVQKVRDSKFETCGRMICWLVVEPTLLKNVLVKIGIFPGPNRGENKKYLKLFHHKYCEKL